MTHPLWNRALLVAAAVSAFVAGSAFIWFSKGIALGLAAGSVLMLANLLFLRWAAGRMLGGGAMSAFLITAILLGKFAALILAAWLALSFLPMEPLAFGLGIVLVPLALAAGFSLAGKPSGETA